MSSGPHPNQRVAWQWEDGWTLVRATNRTEAARLLRLFREVLPAGGGFDKELVIWPMWDDTELATFLFLFNEDHQPMAGISVNFADEGIRDPAVFILEQRMASALPWFSELTHFVSLVRDVASLVPSAGLHVDLGSIIVRCMERGMGRSLSVAAGIVDFLTDNDGQDAIFEVLSPHYVPGRCPDPDTEVHLLLGNLPDLFGAPTLEFEGESGGSE